MTTLWITISILAFVIVLFSVHIKVKLLFSYCEKGTEAEFGIQYLFFKFKIYPKAKEEAKEEKTSSAEDKRKKKQVDIKKYFKILTVIFEELKNGIFSLLNYIIKHLITVNELNISSRFGTGDPMYTGILTGVVNGTVYNIIGLLSRNTKLKKHNVKLDADFDEKVFTVGVFCMLSTNILHILALGAIIIKTSVKVLFKIWRMKRNEQSCK